MNFPPLSDVMIRFNLFTKDMQAHTHTHMLTDDFLWKGKLEGEKDSEVFTFFPTSRWKKSDRIIRQLLLSTVYISVIYQVFVVFFSTEV